MLEIPVTSWVLGVEHRDAMREVVGSTSAGPTLRVLMVMVTVMNLYSAFSINIFKCALQASDLWVRSDISIYRRRWQPLSVH